MALGYAPTPEDEEAQRALAAAGAAPPVIDAISSSAAPVAPAGPPPPPPGGALSVEQLAAAAAAPALPADAPLPAPVPAIAPSAATAAPPSAGDAVDQVLAANPMPPTLAPPPPPADMSAPGAVQKAGSAALAEQGQLSEQSVAAEKAEGAAKQELALAEAQAAEEKAAIAKQAAADQKLAVDNANKRSQRWLDRADDETAKLMAMQPTDFWAGKSTGDKVLAGLSMLFGAAGRTDNSTNPGMQMVDKAIERHFREQTQKIEKQKLNVTAARGQYDDSLTAKQQMLADNELKKAAAYDVAAAQLISLKMRKGATLEQAQTDKDVAALRQKANAGRMDTLSTIHTWNVQDEQVKIGHERAAAMMARATKTKGSGVGGQPGGLTALAEAAEQGATQAELVKMAEGLKIKKPLDIVTKLQRNPEGIRARTLYDASGKKIGVAPSTQSAEKFRHLENQLGQAGGALDELQANYKKYGMAINPLSDAMREREALQQRITLTMKTIGELGALSGPDMGIVEGLAGGKANKYLGDDVGLRNMRNLVSKARQTGRAVLGITSETGAQVGGGGAQPAAPGAAKPVPPAPARKLTDKQLAQQTKLKMQARATLKDPKADPQWKRDAQAYLDATGG